MEELLILELWIAGIVVASALGWIAGHRCGIAQHDTSASDPAPSATARGAPESTTKSVAALPQDAGPHRAHERVALAVPPNVRPRIRSTIFADMPPLETLHAKVRDIRQSERVWDDPRCFGEEVFAVPMNQPASLQVLRAYRSSINELTQGQTAASTMEQPVRVRS